MDFAEETVYKDWAFGASPARAGFRRSIISGGKEDDRVVADAVKKKLKLPGVGQIGYVVRDMDTALVTYRDTFGIGLWMLLEERPEPCVECGRQVNPVLRIALAYAGPVQMELLQVVEGESFHLDHVRESEGGLHHLGFMVRDLDRRLDAAREAGIAILQRGTIRETGLTIDYAYLDTADLAGVVLELIQWRLGPVPVPLNRLLFNLACLLGSGTLLKGRVIR